VRKLLVVALVICSLACSFAVSFAGPAGAATAKQQAKTTADGLVARLLQRDGACGRRTKHGYFGGGASYLASCAANDASFGFLAVVPVRKSGLSVDDDYIRARIDEVCADTGGVVYTAGVRGQFVVMYLGRGAAEIPDTGASVAAGLWNGLLEQLQESSGAFHSGETCANGHVLQRSS
jgi:hypothetical protein